MVVEIVKNKKKIYMKNLLKITKLVVRFPHSWSNFKTEINWVDDNDSNETFLSLDQTIELRDFLNDIIENFPNKEK